MSAPPRSAVGAVIRVGVVVLTLIAALVHLSLLFTNPAFVLNGLGCFYAFRAQAAGER